VACVVEEETAPCTGVLCRAGADLSAETTLRLPVFMPSIINPQQVTRLKQYIEQVTRLEQLSLEKVNQQVFKHMQGYILTYGI
jgi:hypothetical protein